MNYLEQAPDPSLARWLRCFWFLSGEAPEPERIVPDGCPEIVINLADPFERLQLDGRRERQAQVLLVGQLRGFLDIHATGRVCLLGIRFEPAGLFPLLGEDQSRILGARIELASLAPELQQALFVAAADACNPAQAVTRLEAVLRARLPIDASLSPVEYGVRRLASTGGRLRVERLILETGLSARTLERRFHREVGVPPKVFARILRFAEVLRRSQNGQAVDWVTLALDCGYCDQAHLIRDFRAFSGTSPTRWSPEDHALASFFSHVG